MSKERALRRAEREREAAIRTAARAREEERRRRARARRRTLLGWVPRPRPAAGVLAQRRRREVSATIGLLLVLDVLVWISQPQWSVRILAVLVTLLVAPVVHTLLFRRSR